MDIQSVLQAADDLESRVKTILFAVALTGTVLTWVRLRFGYQRKYLRFVRKLTKLGRYLEARRDAFTRLDSPAQTCYIQLEGRIAEELKLDLTPLAVTFASYLNRANRDYLRQAAKQLGDSVFVGFADDLIERLILLLDAMTDLENYRRMSRWLASDEQRREQRCYLHSQIQEDKRKLEDQIQLMQRYLSGLMLVDVYPEQTAAMQRFVLDEKYKAYCTLSSEKESR